MGNENGCKVVFGLGRMADKLEISRGTLGNYIKRGLPARKIEGLWVFHLDNVYLWFQKATLGKNENLTESDFNENGGK